MPEPDDTMNRLIREAAGYRSEESGERLVVTTDGYEVTEDELFPWERVASVGARRERRRAQARATRSAARSREGTGDRGSFHGLESWDESAP